MDFAKVIDAVAGFLEKEGAPFALAGAFALHAYGRSRATIDVDFVTHADVRAKLVGHLETLGYETLHASEGYSNHLHPESAWGRVDVIYVEGRTADLLFAGTGRPLRFGSREIAVPRAEHLAAMKVHAMKNDPGRVFQELADIRYLLQLPDVDREEIRGYFVKAGLESRYEEIRDSLDGD